MGALLGTAIGVGVSLVAMCVVDLVLLARCCKRRLRTLRGYDAAARAPTRGGPRKRQGLLGRVFGSSDPHLYWLHESVLRKERSSQRMVSSPHYLQKHVLPVAAHLARIFGFQQRQPLKGAASAEVYSNVACQTNHLCRLLSHKLQRLREHSPQKALRIAIRQLHEHVHGLGEGGPRL